MSVGNSFVRRVFTKFTGLAPISRTTALHRFGFLKGLFGAETQEMHPAPS